MKKKSLLFTMIAGISILLCATGCEREWTGTIEGTITDSDTEEGIADVVVTTRSEKNSYQVSVITDATGRYIIDNARWGPNLVSIYHPRYEDASKYADVIRDKSVELDFQVDRLREYVDPVLFVSVINQNGDPVNRAILDLYQFKESSYEYFFYLDTQFTAEDGEAEFYMPRMYEDEIIQFQLRVAAFGYQDQVRDFAISWTVPEPTLTIILEGI